MEEYPKPLEEFERQFAAEEACIQYLYAVRWPKGFACPRCGAGKAWFTGRGLCKWATCAYQVSVKAGTIFKRTRLTLPMYFRAIRWVTSQKNGAAAKGLERISGLGSYKTAWTWPHKVRRAMVRPGRDRLGGIVEVDETYRGGEKPGKRGRGLKGKALLVIAAQVTDKHSGRIRLHRVADASGGSLEPVVQQAVVAGSIVRTDR